MGLQRDRHNWTHTQEIPKGISILNVQAECNPDKVAKRREWQMAICCPLSEGGWEHITKYICWRVSVPLSLTPNYCSFFLDYATWCEELTHWKRPWYWEGLGAGGEGDNRGWDGWMASLTWWTGVCVNSRSWWWTGRPGVLQFMGSQRVGHNWATELNYVYSI